MKKRISLFALAFAFVANAVAATTAEKEQAIQTATLKNGSVLYGYIKQNDGRGNIVFHTDSAIVYLENVQADVVDRSVSYGQLTPLWQEWATNNGAVSGMSTTESFTLSDISIRDVTVKNDNFLDYMKQKAFVPNVRLLERGVRYKYVEMSSNSYRLKWSDVVSISAERRSKTALSGIDRIYQTKSGQTYEGQYAGESGTTMSLYLASGVMQTLKRDDVVKYSYRAVNQEQSIFEQSPLLDVVRTYKSGSNTGIIIEQNYTSNKDEENYILLQQETGTIQSIRLSDISEISKERNPKYAPEYDIILPKDSVYINRMPTTKTAISSKKGENVLEKLVPVVLKKGANNLTVVAVEYRASYGANVEAYQLVPLTQQGKGKKLKISFTDSDLVNTVYRPVSIKTSANETTKAVYQVNGAGGFLLYNPKTKVGYPFVVQP